MRRLGAHGQIIQQDRIPGDQARKLPIGPDPDAQGLIGIVARQRLEEIRLIIEEAMLQVHGKRHRMHEHAAWARELVHRLEHIVLVQDVLGRAEIGDQPIFALMRGGDRRRN